MSGRFLLDTNIIIALFANESSIQQSLANAEEVFIPSIAIGELCYGAYKSNRVKENIARIDELAASIRVLTCTHTTAKHYGFIKNDLRAKGRPLPENDIWIAAITKQPLVSRDKHFNEIDDLSMTVW